VDSGLSDWRTDLLSGERLIFHVDSCTSITWCMVTLTIRRDVV
jgi:hypothetical protein